MDIGQSSSIGQACSHLEPLLSVSPSSSLLLPEAIDPETWASLRAHPFCGERLASVLAEAESTLSGGGGLPELGFAAFMRFYRDGDRSEYEGKYFERRRRLGIFAIAALALGEAEGEGFLRALEEVLWSICGEYSWCLPAHLPPPPVGGSREADGALGGGAAPPADRFVDLFSAETAFALAEIRGLLGPRLAPEVAHRVASEVDRRVLGGLIEGSLSEGSYQYDWESLRNNWAAVCAGASGGAGIWLVDDPSRLAALLARLGPALDSFLDGFPADGACLEGMGYWTYGFGYFTIFAELLRARTGGSLDLLGSPFLSEKLGEIARFPQRILLLGGEALGFSDAISPYRFPLGIQCRLARRLPGVLVPELELSEEPSYDHCRRWAKQLRDFAWFDSGAPTLAESGGAEAGGLSVDLFREAQWVVSRDPRADPPIAFAAKGGNNDEPHNHNDVGSFILAAGSGEGAQTFLADIGAGRYDRGYFGPERYEYLAASSLGHSLPIIDGRGQEAGPARRCRAARFEEGLAGLSCLFEIGGAYALGDLVSLERLFELTPLGKSYALGLRDRFRFSGAGNAERNEANAGRELRERFVSLLPAARSGDWAVSIRGRALELLISPKYEPARIEISSSRFEPHRAPATEATIVDFVYRSTAAEFEAAFDLRPRRLP
jgi:Heparinase II/III-like protein.